VGYARVSTDEQTTALQLDALRAAGCAVIHEDSASGALRSRPGLDLALADVGAGDTLVVWCLDRLNRSLWALLDVAETLRERGVALRSLTEHIDTGTAAGTMLYAVLGAVAQFERDVIRERTVSGLVAAKLSAAANALDGGRRCRPCKCARRSSCSNAVSASPTLRAPCALDARDLSRDLSYVTASTHEPPGTVHP
jgi:DNA invertase Pin-like site-specific DNA recombinase